MRMPIAPAVPQIITRFLKVLRHVARGKTDDEGVVASEHEVNHDDGQKRHQELGRENVH
jgi:hypothetical protein